MSLNSQQHTLLHTAHVIGHPGVYRYLSFTKHSAFNKLADYWQTAEQQLNFIWATVCKTLRPMLSDHYLSVCPVCDVGVLWPNGSMD